MREVRVQVPAGRARAVLDAARRRGAVNVAVWAGRGASGDALEVVVAHVSNAAVGDFIDDLDAVPDAHISLAPVGVLTLRPPASEVTESVEEVTARSPFEVFVAGIQSIGTWRSFVGYSAAAGVVVWLGLVTGTQYLLVAAMLIAPYAGPAMNTAVATARGDWVLLWRSLLRYSAALVATAAVAGILSWVFDQRLVTDPMLAVTRITAAAALLPLAAGAAGALHLAQAERNSLVSGAAVGLLVAASLAPPAGIVGMAVTVGNGPLLRSAGFLLLLQLIGINLSGAAVFGLYGLSPRGPRYARGRRLMAWAAYASSLAGLAILLAWQFGASPSSLRRGSIERQAQVVAGAAARADTRVELLEARARFLDSRGPGPDPLLVEVRVRPTPGTVVADDVLRRSLSGRIAAALAAQDWGVTPLVDVMVHDAAGPSPAASRRPPRPPGREPA